MMTKSMKLRIDRSTPPSKNFSFDSLHKTTAYCPSSPSVQVSDWPYDVTKESVLLSAVFWIEEP